MSQLVGQRVSLVISDPWEFGTACGVGPFYGNLTDVRIERIAGEDIERALVTLDRPINYLSVSHTSALRHLRHEGASLDDLLGGSTVAVNITLLPVDAQTFSEIDDKDFSRGFAATGSLQLA